MTLTTMQALEPKMLKIIRDLFQKVNAEIQDINIIDQEHFDDAPIFCVSLKKRNIEFKTLFRNEGEKYSPYAINFGEGWKNLHTKETFNV